MDGATHSLLHPFRRRPPRAYSRMRQVVDRCFPWKYGNDYVSALQTTRVEAPSLGRLHRVPTPGLAREMHFVSAAEARVAAWLVHQPDFIEGLENRPCMPIPGIAVLDGYSLLHGQCLPKSSGTAALALAFGIKHPMAIDDRSNEEKERDGPIFDLFPLTSDLLVLLKDGSTVRAVNLFIKKYRSNLNLDRRHEELFRLERAYYAESNIPTVKISEDDLDPIVTNNLFRAMKLGVLPKNLLPDFLSHVCPVSRCRVTRRSAPEFDNLFFNSLTPITPDGKRFDDLIREEDGPFYQLHLGRDLILPIPWHKDRIVNALANIGFGKKCGPWAAERNHRVELYLPFGLALVNGGNHALTAGIVNGEGMVINSYTLNMRPIYDHVWYNGISYLRVVDGSEIKRYPDPDIGSIFEIGRLMLRHNVTFDGTPATKEVLQAQEALDEIGVLSNW